MAGLFREAKRFFSVLQHGERIFIQTKFWFDRRGILLTWNECLTLRKSFWRWEQKFCLVKQTRYTVQINNIDSPKVFLEDKYVTKAQSVRARVDHHVILNMSHVHVLT